MLFEKEYKHSLSVKMCIDFPSPLSVVSNVKKVKYAR